MHTERTLFAAGRALAIAALLAGSAAASAVVTTTALQDAAPKPEVKSISILAGRSQHVVLPWPAKGASITDPAVADVQILAPQLLLITTRTVGTTNVLAWSESGQTFETNVVVTSDLSRLQADLAALFPTCSLKVTQAQNVVIISGSFERAEQADSLHRYLEAQKVAFVDMTTLAGVQQVQVQVRMAEVSRTALRALGFNAISSGSTAFGGMVLSNLTTPNVPAGSASIGTISPNITLFGGLTNGDLVAFVRALAQNDYLRVLAEPNLVAQSGAEANFLAGGEVPIPVVQGGTGSGAGSISIQFKPFGISLRFRPTVLGENTIRLEVFSEVSEVSDTVETVTQIGPVRTPSFITRRADTTLEMKSGQTFAMAGLLSERTSATSARIPVLGDVPILGALFRSIEYKKGETEMLVLVTASLVEPVSELNLPAMPGGMHTDPNDWELYLMGAIGGSKAKVAEGDSQSMQSLGLGKLRGPGAWMNHGQTPAFSQARSDEMASVSPDPTPEAGAGNPGGK
jgi:pilus assembly protein CpaC